MDSKGVIDPQVRQPSRPETGGWAVEPAPGLIHQERGRSGLDPAVELGDAHFSLEREPVCPVEAVVGGVDGDLDGNEAEVDGNEGGGDHNKWTPANQSPDCGEQ